MVDRPDSARPFVETVVVQLQSTSSPVAESELDLESPHLAERLATDTLLLSVFFQNIDLLYAHDYPGADTIALAIMTAIERLESSDT